MTSSETIDPLDRAVARRAPIGDAVRLAARTSLRAYLAVYGPRVYLTTMAPRVVLQVLFFSYVAWYSGGQAGRMFAFVGACAQVAGIATIVRGAPALVEERLMGTIHRSRLGILPLPLLVVVRWWVFVVQGLMDTALAGTVVGLLIGGPGLAVRMLSALPLYALIVVSLSAFGVIVASLAIMTRSEIVTPNVASYALLGLTGVIAPLDRLWPPLAAFAHVLPMTNGLLAVRAWLAGGPWLGHALAELAVAAVWLAVGTFVVHVSDHHARVHGTDDNH